MKLELAPFVRDPDAYSDAEGRCLQEDIERCLEGFREERQRLGRMKAKIDPVCDSWDKVKQQIHDHEYIYTSSNISHNIACFYPFSRSYFKMKEMLRAYGIVLDREMKAVCLAEAPGGFIQSLLETDISQVMGITLKPKTHKTPYWNRALFQESRVSLCEGVSGTGDLYDLRNIWGYVRQFGKQSVPLITGDGGFDNSGDYNHQEENSLRLIYSEICLALLLQKEGGTFICKLFDTFESETISLLYLLHESYETLSFYKPGVSRWSNSEKYVVCQGFKGYPIPMMNRMLRHFETGGLHYEVPPGFYWRILEVVRRYGETQMWSIQKGLDAIRHKAFAKGPTPLQLKIAKGWCLAYGVPLNAHCRYLRP